MSERAAGLLLMITVTLFCPAVGPSQLIGPSQPIVATLGDDVTLPCYVEPPVNVEELRVDWWRPDIQPDLTDPLSQYKYVHRYHGSHSVEDMNMPSYSGRTALFTDKLKNGNVSLKIMNVKLSDQGRYKCALPQLGSATIIKLIVEQNLQTKIRMTETPPLSTSITTSDPKKKTDTKGVQSININILILAVVVWIAAILFLGVCGYLLILCQNYLPTYDVQEYCGLWMFLVVMPIQTKPQPPATLGQSGQKGSEDKNSIV